MTASIRAAVVPFLLSRLSVLLLIALFSSMQTVQSSFGIVRETRIDLRAYSNKVFVTADGEWFRSIAEDGYARERFQNGVQRNWAFFPAFPLAVRWLSVFPGYAVNALLLTHIFFFAGLAMLHALAVAAGLPAEVAQRALAYAAFFPTSYFFSLPVSESLFLLLGAACFMAAFAGRWWLAGILGALASATRVQGVLLIVFLAVFCWQHRRTWLDAVPIVLVPAGLVSFSLFLWRLTGNAFAFVDIQRDWQRGGGALNGIVTFFRDLPVVSTEWNFRVLNLAAAVLLALAAVVLWRQRQAAMAAFVMVCLLVPLFSGSLQSMSRYVLSAFPAFIGFAAIRWNAQTHQLILCVLATLLGVLCVLFAMHVDIAMA